MKPTVSPIQGSPSFPGGSGLSAAAAAPFAVVVLMRPPGAVRGTVRMSSPAGSPGRSQGDRALRPLDRLLHPGREQQQPAVPRRPLQLVVPARAAAVAPL